MKYIIVTFLLFVLTSSTLRLREQYIFSSEFDKMHLYFFDKERFELEMGSCMYTLKIIGTYAISRDTIFLEYREFKTMDDEEKDWIEADSTNSIVYQSSGIKFINRYRKLIRMKHDKILMPYEINRPFEALDSSQ